VRSEGSRPGGDQTLAAVYEVPYLAHAPLEPQNCVAKVKGGKVEIWAPCQVPTVAQEVVAAAVGVSSSDVLVHTTYAGGGFGRRLVADYAAQAAAIAKRVGRPVKLIWSRESDTTQGYYRPAAAMHMSGAVSAKGRASSLTFHGISQQLSLEQGDLVTGSQPRWIPAFMRKLTARSMLGVFAANTSVDWFGTPVSSGGISAASLKPVIRAAAWFA
jgi:CO/xanthine dehydrogenase Mo-binding subunit